MGFLRNFTGVGVGRFLPPVSPASPAGKRRASGSDELPSTFPLCPSDDNVVWLSMPPEEPSIPGLPGSAEDAPPIPTPPEISQAKPSRDAPAPPAKQRFPAPPPAARRKLGSTHRSPPPTVLTGPFLRGPIRWPQALVKQKVKFFRGATPDPDPQTARPSIAPMAQTFHGGFSRQSWHGGATRTTSKNSNESMASTPVNRSKSAPPPPNSENTPVGVLTAKVSYFSDKRPGSQRKAAPAPLIIPGSTTQKTRRRSGVPGSL